MRREAQKEPVLTRARARANHRRRPGSSAHAILCASGASRPGARHKRCESAFGAWTSAMRDTWPRLSQIAFPPIRRGRLDTLQVNIGYRCNQSCVHCHVNAGPNRSEEMSGEVIDAVLAFLARK